MSDLLKLAERCEQATGPWSVSNQRYHAIGMDRKNIFADTTGEFIAQVPARSWNATDEANAHLIAAAPELYGALVEAERCIAAAEVEFGCKYSVLNMTRAALAKARGEQS